MMATRRSLALMSLAPLLAACGFSASAIPEPLSAANNAADSMASRLPASLRAATFAATPFADAEDINQVSAIGRLVSEQMANRLVAAHGIRLTEIRMANALIMDSQVRGELVLSRAAREHAKIAGIDLFLLGTVSRVGPRSYVNARLVRFVDGSVIGATSFVVSG